MAADEVEEPHANEDKITTNTVEVLRSDLNKISAEMAEEVVCIENRHQGGAASTVSGSTGSGGSAGNFRRPSGAERFRGFSNRGEGGGACGETLAAPALRWVRPKNLSVRQKHAPSRIP